MQQNPTTSHIRLSKNSGATGPDILVLRYSQNQREHNGGDNRARTGDLSLAKAALSQLSYIPTALLLLSGGPKWS